MSTPEVPLAGGNMGPVARRGGEVLRTAGPWTPAVHRLLDHLRRAGLEEVPEPLGLADDGRERLGFLPGDVPAYPLPAWVWSPELLVSAARVLRRVHDASADADQTGPWRAPVHEPAEVVCHNDFAPYNLVVADDRVVGVIDWDFASPGPRVWDLAYLAYRVVPLTTDDWGDGFDADERTRRRDALLAAYGTPVTAAELSEVLAVRLEELAVHSETMAVELDHPALREHAALYRRDAAALRGGTR